MAGISGTRRATPSDISKYVDLRMQGKSQSDAAETIGFSERWGRGIDAKLKLGDKIQAAKFTNPDAYLRPLRRDELSPIALDCLNDFGRFRARMFGRISSPWQEDAAQVVIEKLKTPYKEYGVVNAPPGSGKSTLFTHDIPAWVTVRSRSIRGLIGSATQTTADTYVGRLRNSFARAVPVEAKSEDLDLQLALDAQSTLIQDYGIFRPDPSLGAPWSRKQFTVAQYGETSTDEKESTWTAFGKDGGFLGLRWKFIVWDDLFRRKDMLGEERLEKLQNFYYWYDDEAETRLEPGGLLILQGQRLGPDDIYKYNLNKKTYTDDDDYELFEMGEEQAPTERKYFHVVYKAHYEEVCPVIHNDPANPTDIETLKHVHSRKASPFQPGQPLDRSGPCLLDPVRLPWRELRQLQNRPTGNYRILYQQEDIDPVDALVPTFYIDGGVWNNIEFVGCWDDDREPGTIPNPILKTTKHDLVLSIVTADPSPSKYWAIQWWIYHQGPTTERLMGQRYLIDQVFTPMGANDLLDYDTKVADWEGLLVEWEDRARNLGFPIRFFILEVNAAQKFMKQYKWFKSWMSDHQMKLKPHHTHLNKLDDKLGLSVLRSPYEYGRVRLPGTPAGREVAEPLYQQVTQHPNALYDDCVMANWFLEYQLQHLVRRRRVGRSLSVDMPKWLNREPSYA